MAVGVMKIGPWPIPPGEIVTPGDLRQLRRRCEGNVLVAITFAQYARSGERLTELDRRIDRFRAQMKAAQ